MLDIKASIGSLVKINDGAFTDLFGKLVKYNTDKTKAKINIYHIDENIPVAIEWHNIENLTLHTDYDLITKVLSE